MIKQITKTYTRLYRDSEELVAYIEWIGHNGKTGRTGGDKNNPHMQALLARADREDVKLEHQIW